MRIRMLFCFLLWALPLHAAELKSSEVEETVEELFYYPGMDKPVVIKLKKFPQRRSVAEEKQACPPQTSLRVVGDKNPAPVVPVSPAAGKAKSKVVAGSSAPCHLTPAVLTPGQQHKRKLRQLGLPTDGSANVGVQVDGVQVQ